MRLPQILIACAISCSVIAAIPGAAAAAQVAQGANSLACLAKNVYHEARGEPVAGQVAVGHVVLNRAKDGRSVCSVINERRAGICQFSWVCHGALRTSEKEEWQKSQALALALLGAEPPPDPTHGATHFMRCGIREAWMRQYEMTARIGTHCFYRKRGTGEPVSSAPRGREPRRQGARTADGAPVNAPAPVSFSYEEDATRPHGYVLVVAPRSRAPGQTHETSPPAAPAGNLATTRIPVNKSLLFSRSAATVTPPSGTQVAESQP